MIKKDKPNNTGRSKQRSPTNQKNENHLDREESDSGSGRQSIGVGSVGKGNNPVTDIYELAPVALIVITEDGLIKDINSSTQKILNSSRELLINTPLSNYVEISDLDNFTRCVHQLFYSGEPCSLPLSMVKHGGGRFLAQCNASPSRDSNNLPVGIIAIMEMANGEPVLDWLDYNEAQFQMHGAIGGFWDWDVPRKRVRYSLGWKNMRGYSTEDIDDSEDAWSSGIHPDDKDRVISNLEEVFAGKSDLFEADYRVRRKDGSYFWIHDRGVVLRKANGQVIRMVGSEMDISDLKKAESELMEREKQYRDLVNSGTALIWTSGQDKLCNFFNDTWLSFTGRSLEQEMGNGWAEGVHPDDFQRCLQIYTSSFDKREPFEMEYRLKYRDGTYRWIVDFGAPRFTNNGVFLGYMGHCYDIHVKRLIEESLQFTQFAVDHMNTPTYWMDSSGKFFYVNQASCDSLGYTRDRLLSMSISDVDPSFPTNQWQEYFNDLRVKKTQTFESVHKKSTGETFPVMIQDNFIEIDGNEYNCAFATDVTLEKKSQLAIKQNRDLLEHSQKIAHIGTWRLDVMTKGVFWTNEVFRIMGIEPQSITPTTDTLIGFVHPDDRDYVKGSISKMNLKGVDDYNFFHRIIRQDNGEERILHQHILHEKDETGKTILIVGIVQDITPQEYAKNQLQTLNDDLSLLNAITIAANQNENMDMIVGILSEKMKSSFNSPMISLIIEDEKEREFQFLGGTISNEMTREIESLIGRPIPPIRMSMKGKHHFIQLEVSKQGKLYTSRRELIKRIFGYLKGAEWPSAVRQEIEKLLPDLIDRVGYRSSAATPMIHNHKVIGFLEVVSQRILTEGDLSRIQSIADHLAGVISRKRIDKSLRESEARFRSIFHSSNVVMLLIDPDSGSFMDINEAAVKFYGYTREQFKGMKINDINQLPPEQVLEEMQKASKEERNYFIFPHRKADGEIRTVEVRSHQITSNGQILLFSLVYDITESISTKKQMQDNQQRMELTIRGADVGTWDWNVQTGETVFNDRWAEILGYKLSELEPITIQTWTDLCHPDDLKVSKGLLQAHFNGTSDFYECEARMRHKNGSWVWVLDRGKVLQWDADGNPLRMFGTHIDITIQKKAYLYTKAILHVNEISYSAIEISDLMREVLDEAEILTDSQIGFFHFVDNDQVTVKLQAWSTNTIQNMCTADGKGQHYSVDQAGVWADPIRTGEPFIVNDYASLSRKKGLPEGHAPISRLISIPIKRNNKVVAVVGVGNKPELYMEQDLDVLRNYCEVVVDIIMRRKAEESLSLNEELLRTVVDFTYDMEFWLDENHELKYISPSCRRVTGYERSDFIQNPLLLGSLIHPDDQAIYMEHSHEGFTQPGSYSHDFRIITADGEIRWVNHTCQVVFGKDGSFHGRRGSLRDVTERLAAIEMLRASEEKYRLLSDELEKRVQQRTAEVQDLYDNAPAGYHSLDINGNYVMVNETELVWLGYTRKEMIGHPAKDFLTKESRKTLKTVFPNLIEHGRIGESEVEFVRKDGSIMPVLLNASAIKNENGDFIMSRSSMVDLSERKRAEAELRKREETYRSLFDSSNDAIFLLDVTSLTFIRVNQRCAIMFGCPSVKDLVGKNVYDFIEQKDMEAVERHIQKLLEGFSQSTYELSLVRMDGKTVDIEINLSLIRDASGNPTLIQSVARDISERKNLELTLRKANLELERAMRMKDEFLASMSHELRTPLTGILGLAEAMQMSTYGDLNDRQMKSLMQIEASGKHLLDLINDILDLSKIEAGKLEIHLEACSLLEAGQASMQMVRGLAQSKGQNLSFSIESNDLVVKADVRRIKQMLVNLLSNAVKFTPNGGSLGLEISIDREAGKVLLTVWDKGQGISSDDIKRLFLPFVQLDSRLARQQSGTGLGLSLVKHMAELHGGTISVVSEPGEGSRFTIILPWSPGSIAEDDYKNVGILSIDRLSEGLMVNPEKIADDLIGLGIQIVIQPSGKRAVEKVVEVKPEVILIDPRIQDIPWYELVSTLKDDPLTATIPIVLCPVDPVENNTQTEIADAFIHSPLTTEKISHALQLVTSGNKLPASVMLIMHQITTKRIMVVDDNEVNLNTLCDFLSTQGFRVDKALSGFEAIGLAENFRPNLILMDIQMPGMDGLEATRKIRAHQDAFIAGIPIIALTALAMPEDRKLCLAAGANEYVSKPVELKMLIKKIRTLLGEK